MPDSAKKLRIAVLFGGRSSEHEVSVMSATNVFEALDPQLYDAIPVFVTRDGRWLLTSIVDGAPLMPGEGPELVLVPGGQGRAYAIDGEGKAEPLTIDILFPVLHGLHGEDGAAQGLAEVARVPLVGCSILGSATALDKDIAKRLLRESGVATARAVTIHQDNAPGFEALAAELGTPIFIKPARQGSSVGVSKVRDAQDYAAALAEGLRHDRKLLAEEFVDGREIECSVLEDAEGGLFVSRPGEIAPAQSHGFYSYEAKYIDADGAALMVPADLPAEVEAALREAAARTFRAVGCDGMARVDFFVTRDMRFMVNELNTIPGFTNISMYAKAMAASGVSYPQVLDRLIAHGLARAARDA